MSRRRSTNTSQCFAVVKLEEAIRFGCVSACAVKSQSQKEKKNETEKQFDLGVEGGAAAEVADVHAVAAFLHRSFAQQKEGRARRSALHNQSHSFRIRLGRG